MMLLKNFVVENLDEFLRLGNNNFSFFIIFFFLLCNAIRTFNITQQKQYFCMHMKQYSKNSSKRMEGEYMGSYRNGSSIFTANNREYKPTLVVVVIVVICVVVWSTTEIYKEKITK